MTTYIIWGYPGSGKTTCINHLLSTLFRNQQVMVIRNEAGTVDIDPVYLQNGCCEVKELAGGCACCTLRDRLPRIIEEVKEQLPDILLVEASGTASLQELLVLLAHEVPRVITLVDVNTYYLLMKLNRPFFESQFSRSPVIFLTKTGKALPGQLTQVITSLNDLNPAALVFDNYKELTTLQLKQLFIQASSTRIDIGYSVLPLNTNEVYANLGSVPRQTPPYIREVVGRQLEEVARLQGYCFGYRYISGRLADKKLLLPGNRQCHIGTIIHNQLKGSRFFLLLVATVGNEVNEWMQQKHAGADLVESFVADAIGSALAEAVMAYALNHLETVNHPLGYGITNPYSPGYCSWHVSEQQILFSMLPDGFCDITLTNSSLMLPVKSVSAIVGVGEQVKRTPYQCAQCNKKDCYKRKNNTLVERDSGNC